MIQKKKDHPARSSRVICLFWQHQLQEWLHNQLCWPVWWEGRGALRINPGTQNSLYPCRQMWQMCEGDWTGCEHAGCALEWGTIALCWLLVPAHRWCIHPGQCAHLWGCAGWPAQVLCRSPCSDGTPAWAHFLGAGRVDWAGRKCIGRGRRKGTECGGCLGSASLEFIRPGWEGSEQPDPILSSLPRQGELELNSS